MNQLGRALQFFRPDSHRLAVVVFLLLGAVGAGLLKPWPLAVLVDSVLGSQAAPVWLPSIVDPSNRTALTGLLAISILLLHLAQGGLVAAQHYASRQIGLQGLRRARDEVFACLLRLSARFIHGAKSIDLIRRAAADTWAFPNLLHQGVVATVSAAVTLLAMLVVMWRMNIVVTLVALMVVPLLLAATRLFRGRLLERSASAHQAESQVSSFVQQSIVQLPLMQSYGREEHEASAFSSRTAAATQKQQATYGGELGYWLVVSIIFGLAAAGIIWFGSKQVLAGKLTLGELLIFLSYLPLFHEPVRQLAQAGTIVSESVAGTERVFQLLDTAEEVRESPRARPAVARRVSGPASTGREAAGDSRAVGLAGNIDFEQVALTAQKDTILQGVTFHLAAGQSAAIVGPAGVARTALLHLLTRFYDPSAGVVKLEGVDVREFRLRDLRTSMALVSQEPILLPASIAENIAYGKPRAKREEIEAAARAANAEQFIQQLPNGYLTIIGEGGTRLTPGERHRLNLARAFLKDAPIVLVDETAAEFDAESETLISSSLAALMKGRTTLIAAQRPSTLRCVERILVLRDGRLVEDGKASDLLEGDGYAAKITRGQLSPTS